MTEQETRAVNKRGGFEKSHAELLTQAGGHLTDEQAAYLIAEQLMMMGGESCTAAPTRQD